MAAKGKKIELKTFNSYGKSEIIGHKTVEEEGRTYSMLILSGAKEELWKKIINFKRNEFPNVCALAEILIAVSGSNSSVERAFSIL